MPNIQIVPITREEYEDRCMSSDPYIQDVDWIKVHGITYSVGQTLNDGRHIIQAYVHQESSCAWILTENDDGGLFEQSWDEYDKFGVIPF